MKKYILLLILAPTTMIISLPRNTKRIEYGQKPKPTPKAPAKEDSLRSCLNSCSNQNGSSSCYSTCYKHISTDINNWIEKNKDSYNRDHDTAQHLRFRANAYWELAQQYLGPKNIPNETLEQYYNRYSSCYYNLFTKAQRELVDARQLRKPTEKQYACEGLLDIPGMIEQANSMDKPYIENIAGPQCQANYYLAVSSCYANSHNYKKLLSCYNDASKTYFSCMYNTYVPNVYSQEDINNCKKSHNCNNNLCFFACNGHYVENYNNGHCSCR